MRVDYALVGGGLQNGLIALGILHRRPDARVALIERGPRPGGDHTWCFHAADIEPAARPWVDPLPRHRWPGYTVHFPDRERSLDEPYAMIASADFADAVERAFADAPNAELICGVAAERIAPDAVDLADGRRVEAQVVIDARGPDRHALPAECGYQKFVGLELRLTQPHGLERPVLMEARLPQTDGFRFMYLLPYGPARFLVEDTYFADGPGLDRPALERGILDFVAARGWTVAEIERRESGVLPLPWKAPPRAPDDGVLRGGYQGGFYHPVTGYSLPAAVRLAAALADAPVHAAPQVFARLRREIERRQRFGLLLNRAMFPHCPPALRWQLMSRFYRRPARVIRRFYAMRMTPWDRFIAVAGPVPRCLTWRRRPPAILEEKAA